MYLTGLSYLTVFTTDGTERMGVLVRHFYLDDRGPCLTMKKRAKFVSAGRRSATKFQLCTIPTLPYLILSCHHAR
jgi:hypothetical protein